MSEPVPLRPGTGADAVALAERRARRAELGERAQAGRADAAEALAAELSVRVARLEAEAERGEVGAIRIGRVHELEVELRRAWQLAFAETRRREELEEELGAAVRSLRSERDELRAALTDERERAEGYRARVRALELEAARWKRPGMEEVPAPAGVPPAPGVAPAPAPVATGLLAREAALAARLGPGPAVPAPPEPEPAPAAPEPVAAESEPPDLSAFDAARSRLRAAAPAPAEAPAPAPLPVRGAPWLSGAVRRLAAGDPAAAGEALAALAGVHHLAFAGPLSYRLELAGRSSLGVRVDGGTTRLGPVADPDVVVAGEVTALARALYTTGSWRERRRLRLRGSRGARRAVRALAEADVSLGDLALAGAPLPAPVAYRLLGVAVPAGWMAGIAPFAFRHDGVAVACGAGGLQVLDAPPALELRAEIASGPERLPAFLLGDDAAAEVTGDPAVAEVLRGWVRGLEAPSDRPVAGA